MGEERPDYGGRCRHLSAHNSLNARTGGFRPVLCSSQNAGPADAGQEKVRAAGLDHGRGQFLDGDAAESHAGHLASRSAPPFQDIDVGGRGGRSLVLEGEERNRRPRSRAPASAASIARMPRILCRLTADLAIRFPRWRRALGVGHVVFGRRGTPLQSSFTARSGRSFRYEGHVALLARSARKVFGGRRAAIPRRRRRSFQPEAGRRPHRRRSKRRRGSFVGEDRRMDRGVRGEIR